MQKAGWSRIRMTGGVMEDFFCKKFNDNLSLSYVLFNRVEQNVFNSSKRFNLSISELSMLEAINRSPVHGKMVGDIACELMITPSSVTIAVNKNMARDILEGMSDCEKLTLIKCVERMNNFLLNRINKSILNRDGLKNTA